MRTAAVWTSNKDTLLTVIALKLRDSLSLNTASSALTFPCALREVKRLSTLMRECAIWPGDQSCKYLNRHSYVERKNNLNQAGFPLKYCLIRFYCFMKLKDFGIEYSYFTQNFHFTYSSTYYMQILCILKVHISVVIHITEFHIHCFCFIGSEEFDICFASILMVPVLII